jgi:hypothetical protein
MRQSIDNKRETKLSKECVTVMFHGGIIFLGGLNSCCAREDAALSQSELQSVTSDVVPDASSQPRLLTFAQQTPSPDRTRRRSLGRHRKFSLEEPMARSAWAVLAANPNTRSPQAAATVITTMTEQRRCEAA